MRPAGVGFSATYGIGFDYFFAENYAFSTGLFGGFEQGLLKNRDAFQRVDPVSGSVISPAPVEKYSIHNLDIPLYLKLRTNEFSRFRVFGLLGLRNVFSLSARATYTGKIYSGNDEIEILKEKVSTSANLISAVIPEFKTLWYDVKLSAGIGAEYFFNSKQSLLFGVVYHNGFLDRIRDNDPEKDKVLMRNVELMIGFTF